MGGVVGVIVVGVVVAGLVFIGCRCVPFKSHAPGTNGSLQSAPMIPISYFVFKIKHIFGVL